MDLASAIGVNKNTVANWETGRAEPCLVALGRKAVAVIRQVVGARLEPATNTHGVEAAYELSWLASAPTTRSQLLTKRLV